MRWLARSLASKHCQARSFGAKLHRVAQARLAMEMLQLPSGQNLDQADLDKLLDIVAKEGMVDRVSLTMDSTLQSLGLKSSDLLVVLMAVEEQFGVYVPIDDTLSEAQTLGDLVTALAIHLPKAQT
jgi:acyl carrier protein